VPIPKVVAPPTLDELVSIRALEARAAEVDGHESLGGAAWRDLADPGAGSFGLLVTDDGRAVGYLHAATITSTQPPRVQLATVVDPALPDRSASLGALAAAGRAELARRAASRATLWVAGVDAGTDATLAAAGWKPVRAQHQMAVPLPLDEPVRWPDGAAVRPFRRGHDEAAWIAVNNRAFAGHAEQGGWTEATLEARLAEPGFDPADVLMAWDDQGLAGFDWTKVHTSPAAEAGARESTSPPTEEAARATGEIHVIGVDPDRQGTGLGRALVVAGLDHLARERGCTRGMLFVAATNAPAIALYRALGFTSVRTDRAYEPT